MLRLFVPILAALISAAPAAAQDVLAPQPVSDGLAPAPPEAATVSVPPPAPAPAPSPAPAPVAVPPTTPAPQPPPQTMSSGGLLRIARTNMVFNFPTSPAARPYIAAGQDEAGYQFWYLADPARGAMVKAFNDYLAAQGVAGVVPTWQMLRTATMWKPCGAAAFEVPPPSGWPNMVATLRYVRDHVVPALGPVEPVSVFRNDQLNACAGGARESTHRTVGAIDMVPIQPIVREALMERLCDLHVHQAPGEPIGLGFYKGLRFHIDASRYREWGPRGRRGTWGCGGVLAEGAMPFADESASITTSVQP